MTELKLLAIEKGDSISFDLIEQTGAFSPNNLGGFGAPNFLSSEVTKATISLYPPNFTVPLIIALTIASNVVTAMAITYPGALTATPVTPVLTTTFPFDQDVPLRLTAPFLKLGSILQDGKWVIHYKVEGISGSTPFSCEHIFSFLFDCQAKCCNNNQFLSIDPTCGICDENKSKLLNAFFSDMFIRTAEYNSEFGAIDNAALHLAYANKICNDKCTTC